MSEDIQALIEKINQEGIAAAQEKAKGIESQAKEGAEKIIEKAKYESGVMLSQAKEQISRMHEREKDLLKQAGRDFLLALRQEISAVLDKLIVRQAHDTLTPENMFKILNNIIKCVSAEGKPEIIISLNKEDLKTLEEGFLAKLKKETKNEIVLMPVGTIKGGFVISFDAGKSQFDFSERALAEYIGAFLKPKLKEILQV